ncbi:MAG TPA: MBL fold metallo-hydrolase [Ilumatobacteraceae bacterium]|nr:MBL fold metallo-hydrolase [Ilumatobacteraceae bacterium]
MSGPELYFRQLLSGRDFARNDPVARQMVNFAYAIGDRSTGETLLVDPAYAVDDLVDAVEADGMRVVGALASHYHADHIGGSMMGYPIEGVTTLLERCQCPVHLQRDETPWASKTTGISLDDVTQHSGGDVVTVGGIDVQLIHTPGHTPGSQCFLVQGRLVSGDTLFLEGCGRTDLPGSNPEQMYESLQVLASLPDDTVIFPGHMYSQPDSASLGEVRRYNYVFKPATKDAWMQWFGGAG